MNLLDVGYLVAAGITAPIWCRKARGDWKRRLGHADELALPAAGVPRILVHAVSVGEVNALRALVPMLVEGGAEVVVSVGTDTGIARARELFESEKTPTGSRATVVRYPLDFSRSVRRFLDAVKPTIVGLVELELWPNFITECARRGIPVAVINGRLSARSFRGYRRVRAVLHRTFARLHIAAVQDDAYAQRFKAMGVPSEKCVITGSMKWDSAKIERAEDVVGADALAQELGIDRSKPLIVAGSTGPDEEAMLHAACPSSSQLLCAPRKPERFDEAATAMPGCVRRSVTRGRGPATGPNSAGRFLLDTIGELRLAYALADVVIVGRSFGQLYGSDPIEPIALGKATLIGPRFGDFETIVRTFEKAGGMMLTDTQRLKGECESLLRDEAARRSLGERGVACIRANQGATRRHADLLLSMARRSS
jgi:3-deoxy-D-manno-octulosonic-acid transferase